MNKTGSAEMFNTRRNAHEGFTPVAVAPHKCDNPRTGITSRSAGAVGGTGTVPSVIVPVLCISYPSKWNFPEPKDQCITGVLLRVARDRHTKQVIMVNTKKGIKEVYPAGEGMK